ncbi:MAG: helix-hairpin-helix domain-containing protein [Flavobacteriales bacterium]|nr:helix-hairpin-helix domain-containing protein [Flavobacteriales bacterium]
MKTPRIRIIRSQQLGILSLSICIVLIHAYMYVDKNYYSTSDKGSQIAQELLVYKLEQDTLEEQKQEKSSKVYSPFNPNALTQKQWEELGFSEKQASAIIKFKYIKGGNFKSIDDLDECFVISDKKLEELKPYIQLSDVKTTSSYKKEFQNNQYNTERGERQNVNYTLKKFNPNTYSVSDWQNIGFTEKQATTILKYKNSLGGNFSSKNQLQRCYAVSDEKFTELEPFIVLSSVQNQKEIVKEEVKALKSEKDLNSITFYDLANYNLSDKIKGRIIGFRKALGGFAKKEQVYDVYGIDKEVAKQIISDFSLDESKVNKINVNSCSESDLYNQIYLKKYKQQILDFRYQSRITKESLASIIKNSSDLEKILWYVEF